MSCVSEEAMDLNEGDVDYSPAALFQQKVAYMMRDLTGRGCWKSTIAPPFFRLAWSMGWQLVPPLFANKWKLAVFAAAWWGTLYGAAMWLTDGFAPGVTLWMAVQYVSSFGAVFGIPTAIFYQIRAAQLGLPSWDQYP